jgi:predicted amidohydrolase
MLKSELHVAYIQYDIKWQNRTQNLATLDHYLDTLPEDTDLIVLPEMFSTGFSVSEGFHPEMAIDSPSLEWMKAKAQEHRCAIAGSIAINDAGHNYNRLYFIHHDGTCSHYDKRHLFCLSQEPQNYSPGKQQVTVDFLGWKIRLGICYDLRFPVWLRNNYRNGDFDYDILLLVANWPSSRNLAWVHLLKARAIENQCYAIGVNRTGKDGHNTPHAGNSMVCNLDGSTLLESNSEEGLFSFTLRKSDLDASRAKFNPAPDWDSFELRI